MLLHCTEHPLRPFACTFVHVLSILLPVQSSLHPFSNKKLFPKRPDATKLATQMPSPSRTQQNMQCNCPRRASEHNTTNANGLAEP